MTKKTVLITVGTIVVVSGFVGALFIRQANTAPYELAAVQKGDIIQEVSASGKVESPIKIDLRFKNSGKIAAINVKVGENVSAGQLLAKQDTAQLDAQVSEMQAGIDVSKAKLDQLRSGASPEDIAIAEASAANAATSAANARQSLDDAKQNFVDKLQDAYTKADDAVRNKSDQLFSDPRASDPQLIFTFSDSQLENDVESERMMIESTISKWAGSLIGISAQSDLPAASADADKNIGQIKAFLDKMALIVNALAPDSGISQTSIDKWKNDISAARTNINAAVSGLSAAEENFNAKKAGVKTADGNLKIAQKQLALKKAPARSSDIAVYKAQISQAEASLKKTQAQRDDLMIFAPSPGAVTEINGEVGEIIGSNANIISLASDGALQIKLNVTEDNIVNVQVGQEARIAFDAIERQEFAGKVAAIDPAETVIGGAVYYRTIVIFNEADGRVRQGMTANVWIKTAVSENALFVPASAVQDKDGKKIIQIFDGKRAEEKEAVVGIKNNIGMIEVISGLAEGEQTIIGNKIKNGHN